MILGFYLSLLAFALQLHGREVNVTIDDQYGDPTTGQVVQYTPFEAWQSGQDCDDCTAKPRPVSNAHNSTWTDGSFFPAGTGPNGVSGQIISASVPFIGTAVYVQVILTGSSSSPSANSDFTFFIDNETSGVFQRAPNGDKTYQFNQTVFSKSGLSNSLHTLRIDSGHAGKKSLVLLDSIIYTKEVQDSTNSSDTTNTSSETQSGSSSNVGVIVGPVIGGIILAGAILSLVFFLRRRRQQQGQRERVLSDPPHMESLRPARPGRAGNLGRNHAVSHVDPFIISPNTPYTHGNPGNFCVTSAGSVPDPCVTAPLTTLSVAFPATHAGPTESFAISQFPTTSRNTVNYGGEKGLHAVANTAFPPPPAYREVDPSGSPIVSRLPIPHSKHGLRLV